MTLMQQCLPVPRSLKYFGEYNVVLNYRNDGINYEIKTQIVIIWLLYFKCWTEAATGFIGSATDTGCKLS